MIVIGVVSAVISKFSTGLKDPATMPLLKRSEQVVRPPEDNYKDFSHWQRVENFVERFNFSMPQFFMINIVAENQQYQLQSTRTAGNSLIDLTVLPYETFQEQKQVLDESGEKQFGWTNAYGSSVFEYESGRITLFVVDKEKKEVIKLEASDAMQVGVVRNIARTFESVMPEKDIHGPFYVNFAGKYKLRYTTDYELLTPEAFVSEASLNVKFKDETKTGRVTMQVLSSLPDGATPSDAKPTKVDGVDARWYEFNDSTIAAIWQKDGQYFVLKSTADSAKTSVTMRNLMSQMLYSFRFLTSQEAME